MSDALVLLERIYAQLPVVECWEVSGVKLPTGHVTLSVDTTEGLEVGDHVTYVYGGSVVKKAEGESSVGVVTQIRLDGKVVVDLWTGTPLIVTRDRFGRTLPICCGEHSYQPSFNYWSFRCTKCGQVTRRPPLMHGTEEELLKLIDFAPANIANPFDFDWLNVGTPIHGVSHSQFGDAVALVPDNLAKKKKKRKRVVLVRASYDRPKRTIGDLE